MRLQSENKNVKEVKDVVNLRDESRGHFHESLLCKMKGKLECGEGDILNYCRQTLKWGLFVGNDKPRRMTALITVEYHS